MDRRWIDELIEFDRESRQDVSADFIEERIERPQIAYQQLADLDEEIGLLSYARGDSLTDAKLTLESAAFNWLRVFKLRGTEEELAVDVVDTIGKGKAPKPLRPPGTIDFATTSSRNGLKAMLLALSCGRTDLASEIADRVEDPPNAYYIGPTAECTSSDQHLAYALKAAIHHTSDLAGTLLQCVGKCSRDRQLVKNLLEAVVSRSSSSFLAELDDILSWHYRTARRKSNRENPELIVCQPALGLAYWAVSEGICAREALPPDDPHFPVDLPWLDTAR